MRQPVPIRISERIRIEETCRYILANLDQELRPAALALEAGISLYKLDAGFRQLYGMSLNRYVKKERMEKARQLLLTTNDLVGSIGKACGYRDETSFHRAFKKQFGTSPDAYRRKL